MKKYIFLTLLLPLLYTGSASGQGSVISRKFTAVNGAMYLVFDSLKIMNLTRGGDTVLRYPDTSIVFGSTGIPGGGAASGRLRLYQNYPNPMNGITDVRLSVPSGGTVELRLTDSHGKLLKNATFNLDPGMHRFTVSGGGTSWFILSATSAGQNTSVKIVNSGKGKQEAFGIVYRGMENDGAGLKSSAGIGGFVFKPGDSLLYIGYYDSLQAGIYDRPQDDRTFTFQFAYGIPCPGIPVVEYEGVTYHTVQIFNQCWMRENLNVGTMTAATTESSDNGTIEKYCYGDIEDSCATLGAFYQWGEMMAYATLPGSKGICPAGWHIPSDDDWKILEGVSDSLYKVGDTAWDNDGVRGVTAGFTLKSPYYWANDGNGSDPFGFTVLPSGYRDSWGYIYGFGHASTFWTSDRKDADNAWTRGFGCHGREISRFDMPVGSGYSVRCLRD